MNKIEFLNSYVKENVRPTIIHSTLCWKLQYKKQLLRDVSKFKHVQGISFTTNNLILPSNKKKHHTLFLVDLDCIETVNILEEAKNLWLFKAPYRWIILSVQNISIFNLFNIYIDSDITLVNRTFELIQLYKVGVNSSFKYEDYGKWIPQNKTLIDHRSTKVIPLRRSNFEHYQLKIGISVLDNQTFKHFGTYKKLYIDTLAKSNYMLIEIIHEILNSTARYIPFEEVGAPVYMHHVPKYAYKSLLDEDIDLCANGLFVLKPRMNIKFIAPTAPTIIAIMFRKPRLSYVENLFTLTFDKYTWFAIGILIIISSIFLYGVIQMEIKYKRYQSNYLINSQGENDTQAKFSEIILIIIGVITQQGHEREPRTISSRIVFFIFLLSIMFIYTAYTANIVVILQSTSESIKTLKDLADSKLKFGVENFQMRPHFQNVSMPERKYLADKKLKNLPEKEQFYPIRDGIHRMHKEPFAFATLPTIAYHLVEETFFDYEKCQIYEIPLYQQTLTYVASPFNSSYTEHFRVNFARLYEFGHTKRAWGIYFAKKPNCDSKPSFFTSANIEDVYFAFELFIYGLLLAIFVWFLEYMIHKFYFKTIMA